MSINFIYIKWFNIKYMPPGEEQEIVIQLL